MYRTIAVVWRACHRLAAGVGGSAAVEYAAIVTMVVGLSYMAYALLGTSVQQALGPVADNMPAARDASGNAGLGSAGRDAAETAAPPQTSNASFWMRVAALAVTLLAAGALVLDQRRRRSLLAELQASAVPRALKGNFVEKRQQILRMLTGHARRHPGESITVRHLMTTKLTTVAPSTSVEELCRQMHDTRIRHLLVVESHRELLGIISDRDVVQRTGRTAANIMTANPATVTPDTPAIQAISLMLGGRFSCVPVVQHGTLVGLLTTTDLMMALQCTLQILSTSIESLLADAPAEVKGARYFARLAEETPDKEPAEAAAS
jgi:CBS domain-containing protein